jgi:hypothetical protein
MMPFGCCVHCSDEMLSLQLLFANNRLSVRRFYPLRHPNHSYSAQVSQPGQCPYRCSGLRPGAPSLAQRTSVSKPGRLTARRIAGFRQTSLQKRRNSHP